MGNRTSSRALKNDRYSASISYQTKKSAPSPRSRRRHGRQQVHTEKKSKKNQVSLTRKKPHIER